MALIDTFDSVCGGIGRYGQAWWNLFIFIINDSSLLPAEAKSFNAVAIGGRIDAGAVIVPA